MRHERVVDANVVVKLFVDEELSDEARKFFRDIEVYWLGDLTP